MDTLGSRSFTYRPPSNNANSAARESNNGSNERKQSREEIIIRGKPLAPGTPDSPALDTGFLHSTTSTEEHRQRILAMNAGRSAEELFSIKAWNIAYYSDTNYPVIVGQMEGKAAFSHRLHETGLRILDMPIYLPGAGWKIPQELKQFEEVIARVVEHENSLDPHWSKKCKIYVTIDQGYVEPNKAQRRRGPHGDSYVRQESAAIQCDRLYVCADNCPTPFFPDPCPFDGVDPQNIDDVLAHLVKSTEEKIPTYYPAFTLLRLDPYCVHDVGVNSTEQRVFRTFIKISVSERDYGKLGNTDNHLLEYDPPRVPRHGVPYDLEALKQSSHRKDRDRFVLINPAELNFSNEIGNTPWATSRVWSVQRIKPVFAVEAEEGEVLKSYAGGFLTTIYVAQKNDWKVTVSHGERFFHSAEKLFSLYSQDPHNPSLFVPKTVVRRAVQLTEDVRFVSPWETVQYAQKGDMLVSLGGNDIYAISESRFNDEFSIIGSKDSANWNLYASLQTETKRHKEHLTSIGLKERGNGINVCWFQFVEDSSFPIDLSSFEKRTEIPSEVIEFDPNKKNTLITTDPNEPTNRPEDLKKILDIRLYPALRNLIQQHGLEIFLGSKSEMSAYYESKKSKLLIEFLIPSSAVYYLAKAGDDSLRVVMAGLTGRENIIAQLLTIKLAGIDVRKIEIIGELAHFDTLVEQDFEKLLRKLPALEKGNNALIVAGCGMEKTVNGIIEQKYAPQIRASDPFTGDIVSLTYHQVVSTDGNLCGLISLHLNYGEITEKIVQLFLDRCHCTHVYTGGAGGYISQNSNGGKPEIGARIKINKSMNGHGDIVDLRGSRSTMETEHVASSIHAQIPSIFMETYEWLENARQNGVSSVDVETFYIMRAIQNHNRSAAIKVHADIGYFVSDYVGEKALREYTGVYSNYSDALTEFLNGVTQDFLTGTGEFGKRAKL